MLDMNKKSSAAVILYVLMILSVVLVLTQQLMRSVLVGSSFVRTMVDRERAEMLALGGINVGIATLSFDTEEEKEQKDETSLKENEKLTGEKLYLSRVVPYLNRWHEYALKEKYDGIDGLIKVCITCEQGKININNAFDFTKMEFKKEYESLLKGLELRGRIPAGEMLNRIVEFFKKRQRKIDDISELLAISGFQTLDIFYKPPHHAAKGKKPESNSELALQDIFTTWTDNDKLDLLFLSDSLCAIFGLRRPLADDPITRKERYKQFLQTFKKDLMQNWDENWKIFENIYDQKPKILSELKNIFTKEFGPKVFSVLSCGKVGQVEQHVIAIIREEKQKEPAVDKQKENATNEKQASGKPKKAFKLLRVYWLS
jgi:hypothetical protein